MAPGEQTDETGDESPGERPSSDELLKARIELWKQTVAVQQHFNDLEWRIRQLALTAMTFALGAAAVATRDRTSVVFFGLTMQLASLILVFGLALWLSFYFVDQVWYHRLLIGAVKHGESLESALQVHIPEAGLAKAISANSPYRFKVGSERRHKKFVIHSAVKLRIFYLVGAAGLTVAAVALQFAGSVPPPPAPPVPPAQSSQQTPPGTTP